MNIESIVKEEYSKVLSNSSEYLANEYQGLCTAEKYDKELLKKIPKVILDNDFGCGNPSSYVRQGDAVLDLGSGSGKICYILSQIVGPAGKVFGIDVNPDMLALSRGQQEAFAEVLGFDNMQFCHASIADMKTDLDKVEALLARSSIDSLEKFQAFERRKNEIFDANPLIPDGSIDVVVSNCVINLVRTTEKVNVFSEMFRILRCGGRIAISDNISNVEVPLHLQNDAQLWTACYSGVFQEQKLYKALEAAGFEGIRIEIRNDDPAKVVGEVEFRAVTVTAVKPFAASANDSRSHEVMYRGPWLEVVDENGVRLRRGEVTLVSTQSTAKFKAEVYGPEVLLLGGEGVAAEASCCAPAPSATSGAACCA
jgi:ubiquinone/menaquinone biosynthesis C-methylase UbiE